MLSLDEANTRFINFCPGNCTPNEVRLSEDKNTIEIIVEDIIYSFAIP